jgi:hypothetical protein
VLAVGGVWGVVRKERSMRFVIEGKEPVKAEEPVRLVLVEHGNAVRLQAYKGADLYCPNLITFYEDGSVYLHEGINTNLGFNLDAYQRLQIATG